MYKQLSKLKEKLFRKLSVPKLLVLSFIAVIFLGSILLFLPFMHNEGITINYLDSLFIATSATCVTGLVTVVVNDTFNFFGKIIILLLIQIGGLGLMTFISVALLFIKGKLDFKERLLLKDSLNKENFRNIGSYIKNIVKYSFLIELIGSIFLMFVFIPKYGLFEGIFNSFFLSVSAFCNAGIDVIGASSLIPLQTNFIVNFTIMLLIIMGGLGYAVWFDISNNLGILIKTKTELTNFYRNLKIHTKLVVILTLFLIFFGALFIFIFEYNNALLEYNILDKIQISLFNSVSLRTAGFATFDYSILLNPTKLIMILFMLIGGSPGGTAGGIKTTTFFLLIMVIYSEFKDSKETIIYHRQINKENYLKAFTVLNFYTVAIFAALIILGFTDSNLLFIDLFFEIASAIATVGLSVGITSSLSVIGKIIIILLMFIGRLGPITIAYSIKVKKQNELKIKHPLVDINVG